MKKQTMHWLQNAFSFSASSSNSSHSDDTLIGGRYLKSPLFPNNRRNGGSRSSRQLKRSKKLRHLADNDVELWRSQSSYEISTVRNSSYAASAPASPLPLPMPELQVLLRHDDKLAAQKSAAPGDIPLPSPTVVHHNRKPSSNVEEKVKEKEKGEALNGDVNNDGATSSNQLCRLKVEDTRRNGEHPGTKTSKKSPLIMNGEETTPDKYGNNVSSSAPTSPHSSTALSPRRSVGDAFPSYYRTPPSILQVYSAPDMPPSDSTLNSGMFCQCSSEMTAYSVDNSPVQSPRLSPLQNSRISNALPSPRKLQVETIAARRDGNAQANVHPLPLPPGAVMPSPLPSPSPSPLPSASASPIHSASPLHPASIPQPSVKADLMPIKSQWQKGKLIGRGTFGSVYVASNKETGALCAMKEVEILPDDAKSAECIKQLEQEIKVLSHLKHPNIVQYYGSEIVGDRFYIYLEYVHPGSINKFIHDHCGAITESVVRNFTRHILSGLAYLHSKKTIHRDIKGANLLVDAYGVVKLADFGMAKHLSGQVSHLSLKGSPYWLAPELLQATPRMDGSSDLALAVDIWSLGCTIIEMMNGKPPWSEYEGPAAMFKVMKESPPLPENLSAEGKDFLHHCFRRNPAERPSASKLLEHPFIRNPHPPEILSQSLGGMKLMDNANCQQERLSYKLDQVSMSSDIRPAILKVAENSIVHETFSPLRLFGNVGTRL